MEILSCKDDHILAIVSNNQGHKFVPLLKEQGIYRISNFKIIPGPSLYRSVDRELAISFFHKTTIERRSDTDRIPRYKFELQIFDKVKNLVGQVKCLIGQCLNIEYLFHLLYHIPN